MHFVGRRMSLAARRGTAMLANVPPGDYMNLGVSRRNKMPYENWRTLRVGYSETAFIMQECKDGGIC